MDFSHDWRRDRKLLQKLIRTHHVNYIHERHFFRFVFRKLEWVKESRLKVVSKDSCLNFREYGWCCVVGFVCCCKDPWTKDLNVVNGCSCYIMWVYTLYCCSFGLLASLSCETLWRHGQAIVCFVLEKIPWHLVHIPTVDLVERQKMTWKESWRGEVETKSSWLRRN